MNAKRQRSTDRAKNVQKPAKDLGLVCEPPRIKPWAFLIFLCGDNNQLDPDVDRVMTGLVDQLAKLDEKEAAQIHVVIQHDSLTRGTRRFLLVVERTESGNRVRLARIDNHTGKPAPADEQVIGRSFVRINSGDPEEAIEFFNWGIEHAPAQHYALIFSGLGIDTAHVDAILKRQPSFGDQKRRREFRSSELFSICHDETALDALDVNDLKMVLSAVSKRLGRPIDLVGFDAGRTAFLELAYQIRNTASLMVAPRGLLPDDGWPYESIFKNWIRELEGDATDAAPAVTDDVERAADATKRRQVAGTQAERLAKLIVDELDAIDRRSQEDKNSDADKPKEKAAGEAAYVLQCEMVAIDLRRMDRVASLLDHLTTRLMQSMGDWHVLNAVRRTGEQLLLMPRFQNPCWCFETPDDGHGEPKKLSPLDIVPMDLYEFLEQLTTQVQIECLHTPNRLGQHQRIEQLRTTLEMIRDELFGKQPSAKASGAVAETAPETTSADAAKIKVPKRGLLAVTDPAPDASSRLNANTPAAWNFPGVILLWPVFGDLDTDRRKGGEWAAPSYLQLNYHQLDFCQDVGWTMLLGTLQLILEKPHALWRYISSLLFSRSTAGRDILMRRLFESQSVVDDLRTQFRALEADQALALSIEPLDSDADSLADDEPAGVGVASCGPGGSCAASDEDSQEPVAVGTPVCRGTGDRDEYLLRIQSPGGEMREHVAPVYRTTVQAALESFEELLNSGQPAEDAVRVLGRLGKSLGEDTLQDLHSHLSALRSTLAQAAPLAPHLRLQLTPELMRYPWELISDGTGLLFERFAVGRRPILSFDRPQRPQRSGGPLRVLVIANPVPLNSFKKRYGFSYTPLAGATLEGTAVRDLFRELREDLQGITRVWIESHIELPVTVNQVRDLLRSGDYDIVHFAGHACFNPDDPEGSAWVLSDGLLHAREVRNTLEWCSACPWLVYANACEAGMDQDGRARGRSRPRRRYQSDVFGLGTAFVGHGVRGYLAPLWPIQDDVAVLLATEFYHRLLLGRQSLGEALHGAKSEAKIRLLGQGGTAQGSRMPANIALSWASLVLYGDPTQRLFQSIWGGAAAAAQATPELDETPPAGSYFEAETPRAAKSKGQRRAPTFMPRVAQETARSIIDSINRSFGESGLRPLDRSVTRDLTDRKVSQPVLQLVEVDGIRSWQLLSPGASRPVPLDGSTLRERLLMPAVQEQMGVNRSLWDKVKLVGSELAVLGGWAIDFAKGVDQPPLLTQLAAGFDKSTVANEQLHEVRADSTLIPMTTDRWQEWQNRDAKTLKGRRLLLIIHGTFSLSESPVRGFGKAFMEELAKSHDILAYDHWTLSKSPLQNAKELFAALQKIAPKQWRSSANDTWRPEIDVIVHSRGGLVARCLLELLDDPAMTTFRGKVRNVIFLATPNAGTQLAHPSTWGRGADHLINLAHLDGVFGKIAMFLASLAAAKVVSKFVESQMDAIPGLYAQNPQTRNVPAGTPADQLPVLYRLHQQPTPVFGPATGNGQDTWRLPDLKYWCVAANYEPGEFKPGEFDLTDLPKFLALQGLNNTVDDLYGTTNDLVVDTYGVWAFRQPARAMTRTTGLIPPNQILLFNPDPEKAEPPKSQVANRPRIHHCNVFGQADTQQFIRAALSPPAGV